MKCLPARPFGEPVADRLGLVGPVVVRRCGCRDQQGRSPRRSGRNSGPMARETAALRGDSRAAKREVVPWRRGCAAACPGRIGTSPGLDLALFVDTENQGTIRRRPDRRARTFSTKKGSLGLKVSERCGCKPKARQMQRARGRSAPSEGSNGSRPPSLPASGPRDGVIADLTRRAGAGFVVQTVEALRRSGDANGVRARLETKWFSNPSAADKTIRARRASPCLAPNSASNRAYDRSKRPLVPSIAPPENK